MFGLTYTPGISWRASNSNDALSRQILIKASIINYTLQITHYTLHITHYTLHWIYIIYFKPMYFKIKEINIKKKKNNNSRIIQQIKKKSFSKIILLFSFKQPPALACLLHQKIVLHDVLHDQLHVHVLPSSSSSSQALDSSIL